MGLTNAKLILKNSRDPNLQAVEVVLVPKTRTLDVNPENPNIAGSSAK